MWRELERGVWVRRENNWIARAGSAEEAERIWQDHIAEQERRHAIQNERHTEVAMKIPVFTPVLSGYRRKITQQNFKLPIDTLRDMHLRLLQSVIFIGPEPVYINNIVEHRGEFWLVFDTAEGQRFRISYNDPKIDCRTVDPQYIVYDHAPSFLFRSPARHQKQGMDHANLTMKLVGGGTHRVHDFQEFCRSLKETNDLSWSPQYLDLMTRAKAFRSLRLSQDIAVYEDKRKLKVEYRGRDLGDLNEDIIKADDVDVSRPWIQDAVRKVGCELRS